MWPHCIVPEDSILVRLQYILLLYKMQLLFLHPLYRFQQYLLILPEITILNYSSALNFFLSCNLNLKENILMSVIYPFIRERGFL